MLAIDARASHGLECQPCFPSPLLPTMIAVVHPFTARLPLFRVVRRAWPKDTVLKRRRSVLFAFTFSPHSSAC